VVEGQVLRLLASRLSRTEAEALPALPPSLKLVNRVGDDRNPRTA